MKAANNKPRAQPFPTNQYYKGEPAAPPSGPGRRK